MRKSFLLLSIAIFLLESPIYAGMPSITIGYMTSLRIEAISFFLFVFLVSTWIFKYLWNSVFVEMANLPKVTYMRALGMMILWGMLFNLILTMISGARELMTPGAWEPTGITYKLKNNDKKLSTEDRLAHMQQLSRTLVDYAKKNNNMFPLNNFDSDIPQELWKLPQSEVRYKYISGVYFDKSKQLILLYEPEFVGNKRYVMLSSGDIKLMSTRDIKASFQDEIDRYNER
ncbi:hypothetical protein [Candidatus Uabimicrobium amorphum]|uniref:Uncharacterized protein n=1 Tax=Uabimicrobium amorphum TaxID=2596890 RepID=A0A5S9IJG0_UABAM|nr:hypothetical protein [Candidatus Uabimicrobium amorphum]BBM82511.1 hypothetical protein UABAM_00854 [Candidatus Uabimicrobium amorphum]